jgi:ferredoxin-NADP reductase
MSERYHVAFVGSEAIVPGVASFRFEKPAGYAFEPGQYLSLTLSTREGEQTKPFTHSEAPADPHLEITTRLTGSAFKDALAALTPGEGVVIDGPRGRMVLSREDRRVAFLVGGVGITPARSIIRDAVQRSTGLQVALFYGNQDEATIPFSAELASYATANPEIRVIHVLAAPGPGWTGERGFITADIVRRHVDPLDGWHWVVAGPPAMISAMERVVADLEIPVERVSFERFAGYAPAP